MLAQLPPEGTISAQVYELATSSRVGVPLKRQRKRYVPVVLIFASLLGLFALGWIGYLVYGYIAFSILSHTYPNVNSVPDNQLDTYFQLQAIYNQFWFYFLQAAASLLSVTGGILRFSLAYRTQFYICTDGLLIVVKKKEEAVRWDEVKELYCENNKVARLVKQDGETISLPVLLVDKTLTALIIEEVTRHLLPGMLARYEQGKTISIGRLEVNQQGIYRPSGMVYWKQMGDISLRNQVLSAYYSKLDKHQDEEQASSTFVGTWHVWPTIAKTTPNLPIFVTLVNTILDRRGESWVEGALSAQQLQTRRAMAARARRQKQRKQRTVGVIVIVSTLVILSLAIGIPVYQSVQAQQQSERDTQILQNHFRQLARQPYAVHVPGEHCGNGKNVWLDDGDQKNVYTCQNNGLLMTLNDLPYADAEWFTLVPDSLSQTDAFSSVDYFPHHYLVQVQATVLSKTQDICVGIGVHEQDYMEDQSFDVCTDGNWYFYLCNSNCPPETLIADGTFSHTGRSYLLAVEVTDNVLSLSVDHEPIASVSDATFHSTDQIELKFYGNQDLTRPAQTLFSNFSYTPFSS